MQANKGKARRREQNLQTNEYKDVILKLKMKMTAMWMRWKV
jgi:hypothetical protein